MRETFCTSCGMTLAGACSHPRCPKRKPVVSQIAHAASMETEFNKRLRDAGIEVQGDFINTKNATEANMVLDIWREVSKT